MTTPILAHPPETLEGWYALHQVFRFSTGKPDSALLTRLAKSANKALSRAPSKRTKSRKTNSTDDGWSAFFRLIGSTGGLSAYSDGGSYNESNDFGQSSGADGWASTGGM